MRVRSIINRALAVVGTSIVMATTMPAMAHAQLVDFMWGGDSEWGGKRSTVAFDSKFRPGQVIVSFGDRRLYLITKPGTAMSYPIAVPREQSRWQGRLNVTQKRENPSWTPTPEMLRENPRLPAWVPGGHPMNSARRARALPWLEHVPHSWDRRSLDHRSGRVQGLHSHVQ